MPLGSTACEATCAFPALRAAILKQKGIYRREHAINQARRKRPNDDSRRLHDVISQLTVQPIPSLPQVVRHAPAEILAKEQADTGLAANTDSLCPNCVIEARESIISGKQDVSVLINEKVGEIKAQIIERDGEGMDVKMSDSRALRGHGWPSMLSS